MIGLLCFVLAVLASPFKSKLRLEAANAVLRSVEPDDRSVQADSRYPGFALQGESNAGSGKPGLAATGQCASPANAEATAPQQYGSFSICLVLSLVSVRP